MTEATNSADDQERGIAMFIDADGNKITHEDAAWRGSKELNRAFKEQQAESVPGTVWYAARLLVDALVVYPVSDLISLIAERLQQRDQN